MKNPGWVYLYPGDGLGPPLNAGEVCVMEFWGGACDGKRRRLKHGPPVTIVVLTHTSGLSPERLRELARKGADLSDVDKYVYYRSHVGDDGVWYYYERESEDT